MTYPDRPSVYRVIGPDGRWLGEVAMPANLEVTQIGRDFGVGIWKDPATDLEFVRMYRLRKPSTGGKRSMASGARPPHLHDGRSKGG